MRKSLKEYYTPTEAEFADLWKHAVFALDANVLLDIYRYSPETSGQLLDVLGELGGRVWVPYQAALEYQRNWHGVTGALLGAYDRAGKRLEDAFAELSASLKKFTDSDNLLKSISEALEAAKGSLESTKADHAILVPRDELHRDLTGLLEGKVGPAYDDETLARKISDAERRIKERVPPGYKDAGKPENRFGDVLIWFQCLDHAKKEKRPLVLVTGDSKDDWWWEEGGKTIGPRPELRREMLKVANAEFYMYSTERFLDNARTFLQAAVTDDAIREAREIQSELRQIDRTAARRALALTSSTKDWALGKYPVLEDVLGGELAALDLEREVASAPTGAWIPIDIEDGPQRSFHDVDHSRVMVTGAVLASPDTGRALRALRFEKDGAVSYAPYNGAIGMDDVDSLRRTYHRLKR